MMPQIDGLVQPAETPDMMWWYFRTLGELVDRANEIRKK